MNKYNSIPILSQGTHLPNLESNGLHARHVIPTVFRDYFKHHDCGGSGNGGLCLNLQGVLFGHSSAPDVKLE